MAKLENEVSQYQTQLKEIQTDLDSQKAKNDVSFNH